MFHILYAEDWTMIYKDGVLIDEDHSFTEEQILDRLGFDVNVEYISDDVLNEIYRKRPCLTLDQVHDIIEREAGKEHFDPDDY